MPHTSSSSTAPAADARKLSAEARPSGTDSAEARRFWELARKEPDGTVRTWTRAAGCKVNLGLAITGVRADGYHLLDSVFWPLADPHDTLTFARSTLPGCTVVCGAEGIDPKKNTLTKAFDVFVRTTGWSQNTVVLLEKGVPWGAGLGGGSADAAALLLHLAERANGDGHAVAPEALAAMAAKVGADVPFFLGNRPARVRGVGEILEPADLTVAGLSLVLVTPSVKVSTPWAYAAFDEARAREGGDAKDAGETVGDRKGVPHAPQQSETIEEERDDPGSRPPRSQALTAGGKERRECVPIGSPQDWSLLSARLRNDLEAVVFARYPELARVKEALLTLGARAASMSGSGSSVFGLFADAETARRAAASLPWPARPTTFPAGM